MARAATREAAATAEAGGSTASTITISSAVSIINLRVSPEHRNGVAIQLLVVHPHDGVDCCPRIGEDHEAKAPAAARVSLGDDLRTYIEKLILSVNIGEHDNLKEKKNRGTRSCLHA